MKRSFTVALALACCLGAVPRLMAQAPAGGGAGGSGQNKPAEAGQKPAAGAAQPGVKSQSSANPFPEDTSSVPVLPSTVSPDLAPGGGGEGGGIVLPGADLDPVRSPDDPASAEGGEGPGFSSSLTGLDSLLPGPGDDQPGKRNRKETQVEPAHQETAPEDINVGKYYLDNKDWKAALSRFQSAMVLDPDNPEVYWGLAEADRHLGDFADARTYYLKVIEYDPDSRHAKDARKALKEPEIENAKGAPLGQPAPTMK
jgi:tetratricopeptide (TPR) repeat protein